MKKMVLTTCFSLLVVFSLIGQTDNYEFIRIRPTAEGYITHFDIINLNDDSTADQIKTYLQEDENISDTKIVKLKNGKIRVFIYSHDYVDANYVRAILQSRNVDYDLSSVALNGQVVRNDKEFIDPNKFTSTPTPVKFSDFPTYINTGDKEIDNINYANAKEKWINNNPEKYNELLKEMENK
ncbi:MAG TPA: hypothetical protein PLW77_03485 [Bacteroidales bacterium]|nr:hypothetical protein [Bacteroidales bacterium]